MQTLPQRILIVGTTGSGKTTLAQKISAALSIPHIELDAIHWQENWEPLPVDEFRKRVSQALTQSTWVVDGNYSKVRDITWQHADTVVWLDYGLPRVLFQLLKRTLHRVFTHKELWNENRENFQNQFFSRDSLFIYAISSYNRRKNLYAELWSKPEFERLNKVHVVSPREQQIWLDELEIFIEKIATLPQ